MRNLAKGLVGLSTLAFVLAVAEALIGSIILLSPGILGRASLGLAVVAVVVVLGFEAPGNPPAS